MAEPTLLDYIIHETKYKANQLGGASVTYKASGIHLTVFRAGKKAKGDISSVVLHNISEEDAIAMAKEVQKQCKINAEAKEIILTNADRLKALSIIRKQVVDKDEPKKESESEWNTDYLD